MHWEFAPVAREAGLQTTETELMVEEVGAGALAGGCIFNNAAPDLAGSWVLLAVTVTFPPDAGAVKTPLGLMTPALADQLTAEL